MGLESQLGEEPFVLASLVALLELDPGLETVRLPLDGILQILRVDLLERDVNAVASGHQVVVVHQLEGKEQGISGKLYRRIAIVVTFRKGLILERFFSLALPIPLVTLRG